EHYQWNMDVFGVPGVGAEAELLSAITTFFSRLGLQSTDVGIRVSSRKVLQGVVEAEGVPPERFTEVCVLVDKLDKLPRDAIEKDMNALGLSPASVDRILDTLSLRSLDELAQALGDENEAVIELRELFQLAEGYGCADWLQFDASVVRGLAYYTG
ncbi:MAG TPA: hypothetical protein DIU15_19985, partial [Deltaproteobacteria bacterium]|nr:hypothetical protein [Deltaproteobacteria bacterium]